MNSPSTISLPIRKVLMNTLENGTGTTTTTVGANISNLQLKYPSTAMNKKSVNMYPGNLNNFESFSAKGSYIIPPFLLLEIIFGL